jgi:hypothetical protein
VNEPVPIARSAAGSPIAYPALGLAFHLEPLDEADVPRLTRACDRIAGVVGPQLRWAYSSVFAEVEPYSPESLDLIASCPKQLPVAGPAASGAAPADGASRMIAGTTAMAAAHYDKLGVACHGGQERNVASPWTVRFYSTTTAEGGRIRADAMLAATVALDTPLEVLEELATGIASDLRIRWGAAGLAYGAWELDRYGETRDAIYAHARRHPGFDVGQHATWMRAFHDRVRTVSWLTFLGPAMTAQLRASGAPLESDALVRVEPCGEGGVVLRAGDRPAPGDVNRRDVPRAYVRADRIVRAVRAPSPAETIHFYAPWSATTTEAWLRRFEVDGA